MFHRIVCTLTLLTSLMSAPLFATPKPDKAVFINGLPQSIEYYLTLGLMRYYSLTGYIASNKTFPTDTIRVPSIERLAAYPQFYLNSAYVPPSKVNIDLLTSHLGKIVLHVRDPRDALISWIYFTDIQWEHPPTIAKISPVPPPEYVNWSYEKKADWQIDHFYKSEMAWLDQWAQFLASNPHLQVLVTTFEEMAAQPLEVFREILTFYGTDPKLITDKDILPLTREQFRATIDDIGQWQRKLTPAQQKRVTEMLNVQTARFFKWNK